MQATVAVVGRGCATLVIRRVVALLVLEEGRNTAVKRT